MSVPANPAISIWDLPDGCVPDDVLDPQFEAAVEERVDELVSQPEHWRELFDRASDNKACRDACVRLFNTRCYGPDLDADDLARSLRDFRESFVNIADRAAREELNNE